MAILSEIRQVALVDSDLINNGDVENINDENDATYIESAVGSGVDGYWRYSLDNMPNDFQSMDSFTVTLRAHLDATGDDTWNLRAYLADSAGNVFGTIPPYQEVSSDAVVEFTFSPDTPSPNDKATWDDARLEIDYQNVKNMADDGNVIRITRSGITGEYTPTPNEVSVTGTSSMTVAGEATPSFLPTELVANAYASATGTRQLDAATEILSEATLSVAAEALSSFQPMTLSGNAEVVAAGAAQKFESASWSAVSDMSAQAVRGVNGASSISSSGSIVTVAGSFSTPDGQAELSATATMVTEGVQFIPNRASLSGEASLDAIPLINISAWTLFMLPEEGNGQIVYTNWQGASIETVVAGDDIVVEIDGSTPSPALDPNYWYFVVLNDGDWTVEQLEESDHDGLIVQHVSSFEEPLTQQEVDDLTSYATINAIVRGVTDTSTTTISDDGATGIAANWQTIGV